MIDLTEKQKNVAMMASWATLGVAWTAHSVGWSLDWWSFDRYAGPLLVGMGLLGVVETLSYIKRRFSTA